MYNNTCFNFDSTTTTFINLSYCFCFSSIISSVSSIMNHEKFITPYYTTFIRHPRYTMPLYLLPVKVIIRLRTLQLARYSAFRGKLHSCLLEFLRFVFQANPYIFWYIIKQWAFQVNRLRSKPFSLDRISTSRDEFLTQNNFIN